MKMHWQIFTQFFHWPIFFFTFYSTPCLSFSLLTFRFPFHTLVAYQHHVEFFDACYNHSCMKRVMQDRYICWTVPSLINFTPDSKCSVMNTPVNSSIYVTLIISILRTYRNVNRPTCTCLDLHTGTRWGMSRITDQESCWNGPYSFPRVGSLFT